MIPRAFPFIALVFLLPVLLITACEKTRDPQTGDPAGIVMGKCTVCHGTERICNDLGRMDRKTWEKTVKRMIDHGADVSPQDIPAVAGYLASLKPGAKPVCK